LALVSLDGVAPSQIVDVSASVNLPLHYKVGCGVVWCGVVIVRPVYVRCKM